MTQDLSAEYKWAAVILTAKKKHTSEENELKGWLNTFSFIKHLKRPVIQRAVVY